MANGLTPRRVSTLLEVKTATLTKWMGDPLFQQRLLVRMKDYVDKDAEYRKRNYSHFLEKVLNEIHVKIEDGTELRSIELDKLIRMAKEISAEIRADTPKVADDRPNVNVNLNIDSFQAKFENAGMTDKLQKMIDVTPEEI